MKAINLHELLIRFFSEHLRQQRHVSRHTLLAYRDTFRLLLRFLKRTYHICPATLELSGLSPERVLAFLVHLEQERTTACVAAMPGWPLFVPLPATLRIRSLRICPGRFVAGGPFLSSVTPGQSWVF